MAKFEQELNADLDQLLEYLHQKLQGDYFFASFEDGSDCVRGEARLAVRVYERYSVWGGNRVSLNITILGVGTRLFLSVITSGGSQALFLKVNTLGEKNLLTDFLRVLEEFPSKTVTG